jgi:mono/diheme cytochrome c family protein
MRSGMVAFLFVTVAFPLSLSARQTARSSSLNEKQVEGRRIFEQRCAVCHTPPSLGAKIYGPVLTRQIVDDNEDAIADVIRNGASGRMPGFKYTLKDSEIDAIVEYLKTVPRESATPRTGSNGPAMID